MSENITHTGVVDDCRHLVLHDPAMPEAFGVALREHHDLVRLGGITRFGDQCNPSLLRELRAAWPTRTSNTAPKLAFVLGWMSHRAADRQFKRVFRAVDVGCPRKPTDCSVYHDAVVLREVYGLDSAPYAGALADRPGSLSSLAFSLLQRALIELHTLHPDAEHASGWLDQLIARRQRASVDIARYVAAVERPDPELTRRFIDAIGFYRRNEPLLLLARSVQAGAPAAIALERALSAAATGCLYAQAVARAFRYVRAAGEYFHGAISDEELAARLDIGKPELAEV